PMPLLGSRHPAISRNRKTTHSGPCPSQAQPSDIGEGCVMLSINLQLLRWKLQVQGKLESMWENRWAGVALTSVGAVFAVYLEFSVPPPGVSIAAMGVAAAFMAGRTKATG